MKTVIFLTAAMSLIQVVFSADCTYQVDGRTVSVSSNTYSYQYNSCSDFYLCEDGTFNHKKNCSGSQEFCMTLNTCFPCGQCPDVGQTKSRIGVDCKSRCVTQPPAAQENAASMGIFDSANVALFNAATKMNCPDLAPSNLVEIYRFLNNSGYVKVETVNATTGESKYYYHHCGQGQTFVNCECCSGAGCTPSPNGKALMAFTGGLTRFQPNPMLNPTLSINQDTMQCTSVGIQNSQPFPMIFNGTSHCILNHYAHNSLGSPFSIFFNFDSGVKTGIQPLFNNKPCDLDSTFDISFVNNQITSNVDVSLTLTFTRNDTTTITRRIYSMGVTVGKIQNGLIYCGFTFDGINGRFCCGQDCQAIVVNPAELNEQNGGRAYIGSTESGIQIGQRCNGPTVSDMVRFDGRIESFAIHCNIFTVAVTTLWLNNHILPMPPAGSTCNQITGPESYS